MHVLGRGRGDAVDGSHEPDLRRRRRVRRVVTGTALTLVAAAALSGAQWGQAAGAEQVLQAVNIDLGSNGAITSVADTDIRKDLPGYKTTTTSYAPASVASSLPVSVSTSYIRDGVPGTDVSALALQSGLIEVDVTVTNKTMKPTTLTYPVNGVEHTQTALVGAPLTVTANATLPKGSYARIVQSSPGTSDPHTTNGVVSSDSSGSSTVSWSTLLAPPALSPTTTFRLVEQAQKFQMPQFSLSVAPGLNADPSVDGLLSQTFGTSNSLLATQNQAITLVDQINATLNSVSTNLADIQSALGSTAAGLGQSATSALEDVGSQIGASSQELSGELDQLQSTVSGSVSTAGSTADSTLNTTVNSLISYIGGPQTDPVFGRVVTAGHADVAPHTTGCLVTAPMGGTTTTLYGQLQDVQTLITAVSTGSKSCIATARAQLLATIGDNVTTSGAGACPAAVNGKAVVDAPGETIVCDLTGSATNLDSATGTTGADITELSGAVSSSQQAFAKLGSAVSSIDGDLQTLYGTYASTSSGDTFTGGDIEADRAALNQLSTDVTAASTAASTAVSSLNADSALASAQESAIGTIANSGAPGTGVGSIAGEIATTAQTACNLISPVDIATQSEQATQEDLISLLLTDQHCPQLSQSSDPAAAVVESKATTAYTTTPGTSLGTSSVTLKLLGEYAAWSKVASNSAAAGSLATALTALDADATSGGSLGKMITSLDLTGTDGSKLAAADKLISLLSANGTNPPCSALADAGTAPSVAEFSSACLGATKSAGPAASTSIAGISAALSGDTGTLGTTGSGLTSVGTQAATAVSGSDNMLGQLTTSLTQALDTTAGGQITKDLSSLLAQQKTLMQQESGTSAQLDKQTSAAVAALDSAVGGADKSQMTASASLASLVNQVKLDLGSGSAGSHLGILGAIQSNSAETGIGAGQIDQATAAAGAFKGVRTTDVADNLLTQQQLQAALQLAESMAPFGPALPAGSTHTTVYVFHLVAIG